MSAESEAYRFAQGLITEATVNRAASLSFDQPETHALIQLPPEIRFLDDLRVLDLRNTQLADVSVLRELSGLTALRIDGTQISDLSPLVGMTGLTTLWLENTQASDLSLIAGMAEITELVLKNAPFSDLSPLAGMKGITRLSLSNTQVSDLSPLAGMTGITELVLDNTQISDLSPLEGTTGITKLSLNNTQVSDLSPLAGMSGITELKANGTLISDLSPIERMSEISTLWLEKTQISDLSPLTGMAAITTLLLSDTQISDLSPLARLTEITELWLQDTKVSDLAPLTGMTHLTKLALNGSLVSDLTPLAGLKRIRDLSLSYTRVSDLSALAELTGLTELWLHTTLVSDITPLARLTGIKSLSLKGTQVSQLSPLSEITGITRLLLDNTPVLDLRVLRKLEKLAEAEVDFGLEFMDTAATRADPRIAEIAQIESPSERARTLFDYLESWELPTNTNRTQPPSDDLLSILNDDGRLEVVQSLPTEAERDELLKVVLHERMRTKANDLAQAAGNRFPRLAARARAVAIQVDRPFAQVDLLLLHLEVEDLSAREKDGSEDGDPYPSEVTGPLSDVLRIGPGLTLGQPDVDKLNDRINAARGRPIPADEKAVHDAISHAAAANSVAIGDRLRALEERVTQLPADIAIVVQRPTHRNMLWRIAVGGLNSSAGLSVAVGANVVSAQFQPQIVAFVHANWPILIEVASTYGSAFAEWFAASVGSVPDLSALSRETIERLRDQTRPKK